MSVDYHDVLALILGGGRGERLFPLTKFRSEPAVPLAGKYRIVDIPVSNCINSEILRVFVVTQFNSVSLNSHILRAYRLDNFSRGFVNILAAEQTLESMDWFLGTADAVRQSIRHFEDMDVSHILILAGDQLYQMDYRKLIRFHLETKADVTVSSLPVTAEQAGNFGVMKVDNQDRITFFQEKPSPSQLNGMETALSGDYDSASFPSGKAYIASMGLYVFEKSFLIRLLRETDNNDFAWQILPGLIEKCRVMAYRFAGYWTDIGTLRSYYEANLELTTTLPRFNFYNAGSPVYTRARFLPGSVITNCKTHQVIIGDGCFLNGVDIQHSIIGARSCIGEGTSIRNSYVIGAGEYETQESMRANASRGIPNVGIGREVEIVNAIVDRNARIGNGVKVVNAANHTHFDGENFYVRDKVIVIPKGAVIPDGTTI